MSTQPINILAVDDDRVTLELLSLVLEEYTTGEVLTFSKSTDAISAIKERGNSLDLVISDMVMPEKNGLDVLAAYRKVNKQSPFLMLTANATRDTVLSARKLGANAFVAKPFATHDLLDKMDSILSTHN